MKNLSIGIKNIIETQGKMDIIYIINYIKYSFKNLKLLIFIPPLIITLLFIFISRDLFFKQSYSFASEFKFNIQLPTFMDLNNIFVTMENYQEINFGVTQSKYLSAFILKNLEQTNKIKKEIKESIIKKHLNDIDEDFLKNEAEFIKNLERDFSNSLTDLDKQYILKKLIKDFDIDTDVESIIIEFKSPLSRENSIIFYDHIKNALSDLLIQNIEAHSIYVMNRINDAIKSFKSLKEVMLQREINEINDQIEIAGSLDEELLNKYTYVQDTIEGLFWNMEYLKKKNELLKKSNVDDMFTDYEAEKYAIFFSDFEKIDQMKKRLEILKSQNDILQLFFYENAMQKSMNNSFMFLYLLAIIFASFVLSFLACFYIYKFKNN